MKNIKLIVIHCSATKENKDFDRDDIKRMHLSRGFNDIGYHFVIKLDGTIEEGRALDVQGAHVRGYNSNSWGICYIGGLDSNLKPKDTRTEAQKESMKELILRLKEVEPKAKVVGHRDLSPDKNKNGIIEPHEWVKSCPCFNVSEWLKETNQ